MEKYEKHQYRCYLKTGEKFICCNRGTGDYGWCKRADWARNSKTLRKHTDRYIVVRLIAEWVTTAEDIKKLSAKMK